VRLAFAVAAHLDPEILIVDEVLAVGDAEFQKKCLGKMGDVAGEGRTVLFVSHNMAAIENLCSKVLVINNGSIVFNGESRDGVNFYYGLRIGNNFHRKSSKKGYIKSVKLVDNSSKLINDLKIGDDINFSIELSPKCPSGIVIGIGINDVYDTRITTILSSFKSLYIDPTRTKNIICKVKNLSLLPGIYNLKIAISSPLIGEIESLEITHFFEILLTDFWKTGKLPTSRQGFVLTDHEWVLSERLF